MHASILMKQQLDLYKKKWVVICYQQTFCYQSVDQLKDFCCLPTKCFGAHWGLAAAVEPEYWDHLMAPAREQGRLVGSPGSGLQAPPWGQVKAKAAHLCTGQNITVHDQGRSVTDPCRAAPEDLEMKWNWGHGPPQVRLLKATGDYQSQKKTVESKQVSWIKQPSSCSLFQWLKAHKVTWH